MGIGSAIVEMVPSGRWSQLARLQGARQPEQLFQTLPGTGPELAVRIHHTLHVETLAALELASHAGRPSVRRPQTGSAIATFEETYARMDRPSLCCLMSIVHIDKRQKAGELRTLRPFAHLHDPCASWRQLPATEQVKPRASVGETLLAGANSSH